MHLILNGNDEGVILEWKHESLAGRYQFLTLNDNIYIMDYDVISIKNNGNIIVSCIDFQRR